MVLPLNQVVENWFYQTNTAIEGAPAGIVDRNDVPFLVLIPPNRAPALAAVCIDSIVYSAGSNGENVVRIPPLGVGRIILITRISRIVNS